MNDNCSCPDCGYNTGEVLLLCPRCRQTMEHRHCGQCGRCTLHKSCEGKK